jgi:hypothetical protein
VVHSRVGFKTTDQGGILKTRFSPLQGHAWQLLFVQLIAWNCGTLPAPALIVFSFPILFAVLYIAGWWESKKYGDTHAYNFAFSVIGLIAGLWIFAALTFPVFFVVWLILRNRAAKRGFPILRPGGPLGPLPNVRSPWNRLQVLGLGFFAVTQAIRFVAGDALPAMYTAIALAMFAVVYLAGWLDAQFRERGYPVPLFVLVVLLLVGSFYQTVAVVPYILLLDPIVYLAKLHRFQNKTVTQ